MYGFISYAHEDDAMFREFVKHLTAVHRALGVDWWYDTHIKGGRVWRREIQTAIEKAEVFVLLASPSFLASSFIHDHELPAIKLRHAAGALILPTILKRCYWQYIAEALQAMPTADGRLVPIADWRPQGHGYDSAREQIMDAVQSYFRVSAQQIDWTAP